MAFTSDNDFKIPIPELLYISPDARQTLFLKLVKDYKMMVPSLKCIYANLCWGNPEERTHEIEVRKRSSYDVHVVGDLEYLKSLKETDETSHSLTIEDTPIAKLSDGDKMTVPKFDQPCKVDYVLIFSAKIDNHEIIFMDLPFIFTKRSVPGYRYCLREQKTRDFFTNAIEEMCRLPKAKFDEFIEMMANLSNDSNSDKYWKKPDNADKLMQNLVELQLRYTKRMR